MCVNVLVACSSAVTAVACRNRDGELKYRVREVLTSETFTSHHQLDITYENNVMELNLT